MYGFSPLKHANTSTLWRKVPCIKNENENPLRFAKIHGHFSNQKKPGVLKGYFQAESIGNIYRLRKTWVNLLRHPTFRSNIKEHSHINPDSASAMSRSNSICFWSMKIAYIAPSQRATKLCILLHMHCLHMNASSDVFIYQVPGISIGLKNSYRNRLGLFWTVGKESASSYMPASNSFWQQFFSPFVLLKLQLQPDNGWLIASWSWWKTFQISQEFVFPYAF